MRSCPPEFGAIFDRGLDVVIIPELCSGCPVCVMVCPVDCIYVDEEWAQTDSDMWNHVALTADEAVEGDDRGKRRGLPGRPDQGTPGPPPTP